MLPLIKNIVVIELYIIDLPFEIYIVDLLLILPLKVDIITIKYA